MQLLAAATAALAAVAVCAAGRPLYAFSGGSAARTYQATGIGPQPAAAEGDTAGASLQVLWTFSGAPPGQPPPGFFTPSVDGNGVPYIGSDNGQVNALDPATGIPVWTLQATPTGVVTSPAFADDGSFYMFLQYNSTVAAFSPDREWKWALGVAAGGTPLGALTISNTTGTTYGDGSVHVLVWVGSQLLALDADTGAVKWKEDGVTAPPAVDSVSGMVVAATTSGQQAFFPTDGAGNWTFNAYGCTGSDTTVLVVCGGGCTPSLALFACGGGYLEVEVATGLATGGGPFALGSRAASTPGGMLSIQGYPGTMTGYSGWGVLQKWQLTLSTTPYQNQVVDAQGTIYVTSGNVVAAVNGTTGALLWTANMPTSVAAVGLAIGNGTLFTTGVGNWGVMALGFATPRPPVVPTWPSWGGNPQHTATSAIKGPGGRKVVPAWTATVPGDVESSFAVGGDGATYFGTNAGAFVVVDATGVPSVFNIAANITTTPAISSDGSTVFVGASDGRFYAYAVLQRTLTPITNLGSPVLCSPVIDPSSGDIYIGTYATRMESINAHGSQVWDSGVGCPCTTAVALTTDGQTVAWAGMYGQLCYISLGHIGWALQVSYNTSSSPTLDSKGIVYIGSGNGALYGYGSTNVDAASGEAAPGEQRFGLVPVQVLKYQTGGAVTSSPALDEATGTLFFGSADAHIYAVTTGGELQWKYQTGGPVVSSPLLDGSGTVVCGSTDGVVYGIDAATGKLVWHYNAGAPVRSSPVLTADGLIIIAAEGGAVIALTTA